MMVSAPLPTRSALLHPGPSAKGTAAAAAAAARHPPEQQPMCALIAVGGYLKPILQIGALDTNISNLKKKKKRAERKKSGEIKTPSFTFLRNMKLCF